VKNSTECNNVDFFERMISIFRSVYEETRKHRGWLLWRKFDLFVVDVHNLIVDRYKDKMPPKSLTESLTYQRILDLIKTAWLITFNVYSGAYRSAMRNLRFILEALIQAYYLDKKFPYTFATEKFEYADVNKLYGTRLMRKARMPRNIRALYQKLCKYVHSSKEELEHIDEILMEKGTIDTTFVFDEDLFEKCRQLTMDSIDAISYVIIKAFPEIAEEFGKLVKERELEEAFRKSELKLCANFLCKTE